MSEVHDQASTNIALFLLCLFVSVAIISYTVYRIFFSKSNHISYHEYDCGKEVYDHRDTGAEMNDITSHAEKSRQGDKND
jgi:xanthosine utilization system XapX-like protein